MVPNLEDMPSHEGIRRSATVHVRGGGKVKKWRIDGRSPINYNKVDRLLQAGVGKSWAMTFIKLMSGLSEDQKHYMRVNLEYKVWPEDRTDPHHLGLGSDYIIDKDGILKVRPKKKMEAPTRTGFIWFDFGGSLYCRYGEDEAIHRVVTAEPMQFMRPVFKGIFLDAFNETAPGPSSVKEWHYMTDRMELFPGGYAIGNNGPFDGFDYSIKNEMVAIEEITRLKGMYVKSILPCPVTEAKMVEKEIHQTGKELFPLEGAMHQLRVNCRRKRA